MAQIIRNVKIGDKFIVNAETAGFEHGIIVESVTESKNISGKEHIRCKYVSGESQWKNLELWQKIVHLKIYEGEIK